MAKPDCDDGWIKKSVELEAALDFADFGKYARIILRYAFSQLFGGGKRPPHAILSCSEIAERVGRSRQLLHRGLDQLVASGVLARVDGVRNGFRFVKDYERWVEVNREPNGSHSPSPRRLLTDAEVADCKAAPGYARGFANGKSVIQRDDNSSSNGMTKKSESVIQRDDKPEKRSSNGMTSCHPVGVQAVVPLDDKTASPHTPLLGTELQNTEFSLSSDEDKAAAARKKSRKKSPAKVREVPVRPAPVEGDDAAMKWVRDMILNATRDEKHPGGDADRAAQSIQAMLEWRARNYTDADLKLAFQTAVQKGTVRKPSFFEFVKAVLVGETDRRAAVPTAPARPLPKPIEYHVAPPRPRPRPIPSDPRS